MEVRVHFCSLRKIPVNKRLRMNDSQVQSSYLARDAAARGEQIPKHQAQGNFMFREFLGPDVADTVLLSTFLYHIDHLAPACLSIAIGVAANLIGSLLRFVGNFFSKTKV